MTTQEAKKHGFTHKGLMYGIPIYFTVDDEPEVVGRNEFYDFLLETCIAIDILLKLSNGFTIENQGYL